MIIIQLPRSLVQKANSSSESEQGRQSAVAGSQCRLTSGLASYLKVATRLLGPSSGSASTQSAACPFRLWKHRSSRTSPSSGAYRGTSLRTPSTNMRAGKRSAASEKYINIKYISQFSNDNTVIVKAIVTCLVLPQCMEEIRRVRPSNNPDANCKVSFVGRQRRLEEQPQCAPRVQPRHAALPAAEVHGRHAALRARCQAAITDKKLKLRKCILNY